MINSINLYSPWSLGFTPSFSPISSVSPVESGWGRGMDSVMLGSDLNSAGDFLNQMAGLRDMARRQKAVSDLGSTQMPANWETMPLEDFLNEMGRIRQKLGPSKTDKPDDKKKDGDGKGTFGVNAHRYWDYTEGKYVEVQKVQIHEKGNWSKKEPTTWNAGHANEVSTQKKDAELGKTYQVTVTWENGQTKTWDYTNSGQTVDVWGPNN